MKDGKGGKRPGRPRSVGTRQKRSSTGPRKPKTRGSLTLAEDRGLHDFVMTAPQEPTRLAAQRSSLGVWDLQFSFWTALLKLSPLPGMLRQQAAITRLLFDVWLPKGNAHEKGGIRQRRKRSVAARKSGSTENPAAGYQAGHDKEMFRWT